MINWWVLVGIGLVVSTVGPAAPYDCNKPIKSKYYDMVACGTEVSPLEAGVAAAVFDGYEGISTGFVLSGNNIIFAAGTKIIEWTIPQCTY